VVGVLSLNTREIDKELQHRRLAADELTMFLRYRFKAENRPLIWNWHLDYICEALEAQTRRELRKLMVLIPPGHLKSELVSQTWPAWMIGRADNEDSSVLSASNSAELATRDSEKTRGIVQSEWFRRVFPTFGLDDSGQVQPWPKDQQHWWTTPGGASREAVGVGTKTTGRGARRLIMDDPLAVEDANSDAKRQAANRYYTETWLTRQRDQVSGTETLIMQRLHELDTAGMILDWMRQEGGEQWEVIELPTESSRRRFYALGAWKYERQPGELLFPKRLPATAVATLKRQMPAGFQGQYNMRPNKMEGNLLRTTWLVEVDKTAEALRDELALVPSLYLDFATKEKEVATDDPDYNVITVWARDAARRYFKLDQWRRQCDLGEMAEAILLMHRRWAARFVKGEKGALINALEPILREKMAQQHYYVRLDGLTIGADKVARAGALRGAANIGLVHVPKHAPWLSEMKLEWAAFPNGAHDDIVDADAYAARDLQDVPGPKDEQYMGGRGKRGSELTGQDLLETIEEARRAAERR